MEWMAYTIVGVFTGLTASIMTLIEENSTDFRKNTSDNLIADIGLPFGWLMFSGMSAVLVLIATTTTIFWGPGANGSGVAELMGYLNGINYPNVFGFETFVTKTFCVVFAVVGGLCVGKEGPLAHIGANIGICTAYLPLPGFSFLRNDTYKRRLIAAGTSAGVSAAFGAPIGGALFAYEISKPNTFWKFSVIWKVFYTCAIAVFFLALFNSLMNGLEVFELSSSVLKFGNVDIAPPTLVTLPGSVICGVVTGLLGSVFVLVNSNLALLRKKHITANWMKITEAVFFSLFTTSMFFWLPRFLSTERGCKPVSDVDAENMDLLVNFDCPKDQYSPLASMFFNTEGDAIRTIISGFESKGGIQFTWEQLLIYFCAWYFFTIVTYGVWVPAGLFLPGIIIGCAVGGLYAFL